jgi:hypothetical protein
MKQFVLKVPGIVFLIALFLPAIMFILWGHQYISGDLKKILYASSIFQWLSAGLWYMSLLAYFSHEKKSFEGNNLVILLIALATISGITLISTYHLPSVFALIPALLMIYPIVKIVLKVREVFYARSLWFLVFEIIIPPIGFLTLTPEIKRWEKSDKI